MRWSSEGGGEKHVWGGSNPKEGGGGGVDAPGSFGGIFMSWL